jgi:fibronectin-binding autotransporter adhesin
MPGKTYSRSSLAANRSRLCFFAMGLALCLTTFLPCTTATSHAAIIGTGDVSPSNPATWTSSTTGYIGQSSTGSVTVNGGSGLLNYYGYLAIRSGSSGTVTVTGIYSTWTVTLGLTVGQSGNGILNIEAGGQVSNDYSFLGYNSGSSGTATVNGTGSRWINSDTLYVGEEGNGTLNIQAGGQVSNANGFLAYSSGSNGTVMVTGVGSNWTNSGKLFVGHKGTGILNIDAGGQVSNGDGYLGYYSGSTGTATVTGTSSTWTNSNYLYVGYSGSGTLTVENGGVVTAKTLYASLSSLLGNGHITAYGTVLDADLVFDSTHGMQQNLNFGSGGTLHLNLSNGSILGAGHKDTGTLRIDDGIEVTSSTGYLGFAYGSDGTATVTGTNSKWTNTSSFIGYFGSGTLNIEAGGQASSSKISYLGYQAGSTGRMTVTGAGSKWTNSDLLFLGYYGNGALNIEAGGQINSASAWLSFSPVSTGSAMVTGTGSKWTITDSLEVYDAGTGTLTVTDGGTVAVNNLRIRYKNLTSGTLTVSNGGIVNASTIYSSISALLGDGIINARGAVLDNAVVIDSVHGLQQSIAFGTGGTLNLNLDGSGALGAGFNGTGSLRISDGVTVLSSDAYLGYDSNSTGTAMVVGTGSKWIVNNHFYLSYFGSGTLNIGDSTGSGALVVARNLHSGGGEPVGSTATCNLNNGGILQVQNILYGETPLYFRWNDGTIRNYDPNTDLTISNRVSLALAATGTHTFDIDASRTGWINASLRDATTNGTLTKTGEGSLRLSGTNTYSGATVLEDGILYYSSVSAMTSGPYTVKGGTLDIGAFSKSIGVFRITGGTVNGTGTLTSNAPYDVQAGTVNARLASTVGLNKTGSGIATLTAANTYSGGTTVEEGLFKVTGSIANTSGIDVAAGATLELAKISGSATAASLAIDNDGTVLISAGMQTVGTISGTGITQVNAGATLTAASIAQSALVIDTATAFGTGETPVAHALSIDTTTAFGTGETPVAHGEAPVAHGSAGAASMDGESTAQQVPEPGTLALSIIGVFGAFFLARRRKR